MLFVINPFDKRLDVLKTRLSGLTFCRSCKFSRTEFINENNGSQPGHLAKWLILGKFSKCFAEAKILKSSKFKRLYLFRYKLVFYVLYIPGIVGQHTNIFLISRDG